MSLKTHRTSFQMLVQKIMYHFVHTVLIYFKLRMAKKFTKRKKKSIIFIRKSILSYISQWKQKVLHVSLCSYISWILSHLRSVLYWDFPTVSCFGKATVQYWHGSVSWGIHSTTDTAVGSFTSCSQVPFKKKK